MARYLIIDTHDMAIPRLGRFGRVLTPEETEAKWKEVFEAGASDNRDWNHSTEWGFDYKGKCSFEKIKQSL